MTLKRDVMRIGERRGLTAGEIALGKTMFGADIDWAKLRIHQARPLGFGAMVPIGNTIVFSKWRALRDFGDAALPEQAWFIHELAHVWQASGGTVLAFSKLKALGAKAYTYRPASGVLLKHYNIEQQAEIARHLFLARKGAGEQGAPPLSWLEETWATRRAGAK